MTLPSRLRAARFPILALLLLLTLLPPAQAFAQGDPARVARWNAQADRVEAALDDRRPPLAELRSLRDAMATQRAEAQEIVTSGSVGARAAQASLEALPAPPAEGATEAPGIAQMREQLASQIAEANTPVIEAQQALTRADLLIHELDGAIRDRMARSLVVRLPSPLNPATMMTAGTELGGYLATVGRQYREKYEEAGAMRALAVKLLLVLMFVAAAIAILTVVLPRVTRHMIRLERATMTPARRRLVMAGAFLAHLGVIAAAWALFGFSLFIIQPGVPAMRTLAGEIPAVLGAWFAGYVLGRALFLAPIADADVEPARRRQARRGFMLLLAVGFYVGAQHALDSLDRDWTFSPAAQSALMLPVALLGASALFLLGRALRRDRLGADAGGESGTIRLIGLATMTLAILGLAAVLAGYTPLGHRALYATAITIGVVSVGLLLYRAINAIFDGSLEGGKDQSLRPIAVAIAVAVPLLPLVALAWGAETTDLGEAWLRLSGGISIGNTRLPLSAIVTAVAVFAIGLGLTRWFQRLLGRTVLPRTKIDIGSRNALVTGAGYIGLVLAALIAVSAAGINLTSLAFVAGALSLGIGFGLQTIVSNFVSGIILLVERPIKEGDWIEVAGYTGVVRRIAVRSTRIETFDRHDVILPNTELIAGTVKNITLGNRTERLIVPVGVAYGTDVERVFDALAEVGARQRAHLADPDPVVLFTGLGESALNFELRLILSDVSDVLSVQSAILRDICRTFGSMGIEIPFPKRDITIEGLDALVAALARPAPTAFPAEASSGGGA